MKQFILKILIVFSFILMVFVPSFANDLNITSITFDNSSAFLSINTQDNEEFTFTEPPKITIVEEESIAYFDLNSAILKCPGQDFVISSSEIKEIAVKQFSVNPNIVRVVIKYNESFNPKNIQFRRFNNSFFVPLYPYA